MLICANHILVTSLTNNVLYPRNMHSLWFPAFLRSQARGVLCMSWATLRIKCRHPSSNKLHPLSQAGADAGNQTPPTWTVTHALTSPTIIWHLFCILVPPAPPLHCSWNMGSSCNDVMAQLVMLTGLQPWRDLIFSDATHSQPASHTHRRSYLLALRANTKNEIQC
jgi:hypothetical protein